MRKRKKFRSRPIQIELSVLEIESLVRKLYLKAEEQDDPAAISLATMDFLTDHLAT
jgi:hypothetical protein